ncbi:MAG TPA: Hsp20 family protein [Burkholderiales bacterium]
MDPLKELRFRLGRGVVRAYEDLAEGWRDLLGKSGGTRTQFDISDDTREGNPAPEASSSRWDLLPAETWETAQWFIVRMEIAGVRKEDIDVSIRGRRLRIRGARHSADPGNVRAYRLAEREFERFERSIALPPRVDGDAAEISCKDGVITVIISKQEATPPRKRPTS